MDTGGYEYGGTGPAGLPVRDRAGQAEAFDAIGARYDVAFPHKEGQIAAGEWLATSLPLGSRVLDLGCGTGLPTAGQLAAAGLRVTGVDISRGMLALARQNVPEAEFHEVDIADIAGTKAGTDGTDLLGADFAGVAAFFSVLMLPRREIPTALRLVHGVLAPGGLLALGMVEADVDDMSIPFLGNTIRVSGYLRDELRQVVTDAGFEVTKEDSYSYAPATSDVPPEEQIFLYCRRA